MWSLDWGSDSTYHNDDDNVNLIDLPWSNCTEASSWNCVDFGGCFEYDEAIHFSTDGNFLSGETVCKTNNGSLVHSWEENNPVADYFE